MHQNYTLNLLSRITLFIEDFNNKNGVDFQIDTIRINFFKQYNLDKLNELGSWHKIEKNNPIMSKLKKRLFLEAITSAYQLENYPIYYYNIQDKPKYRKAQLVIYGLSQYHKAPPPYSLVENLTKTLRNITNIDLCYDFENKPNIDNLSEYKIEQYIDKETMLPTNTYYINDTGIPMIERVCIYDKSLKNKLSFNVNRFEATISIPNIKYLNLPLYELNKILQKVLH